MPLRPADLARPHGLSAQAIRNYEAQGLLPPVGRSDSGYRQYTQTHARALVAFRSLAATIGHGQAGEIMRAIHRTDIETALSLLDDAHALLARDRHTLAQVNAAAHRLTGPENADLPADLTSGELAARLGVTAATLREWERLGLLHPARDRATGYRRYRRDEVRDAELIHLLRRGNLQLTQIAVVVDQVRDAGSADVLAASLHACQEQLTARGLALLKAASALHAYVDHHSSPRVWSRRPASAMEPDNDG